MDIDVRPSEDAAKYLATDQLVWFGEVTDADADHLRLGLPEDQRFVVDLPDGPQDLHAGIYGVRPMEMSLPGGSVVPIAGLTWVGVHPDVRRRGVLSAMMTDHLSRSHDAGMALSALHASEVAIYGRYGYGMAALQLPGVDRPRHDVHRPAPRGGGAADHHPSGRHVRRPVWPSGCTPASSHRSRRLPRHDRRLPRLLLPDVAGAAGPAARQGARRILFARRNGEDIGFAGLRREHKWDNARPSGTVAVGTFTGSPAARLALARRVVDLDLMGTTKLENIGADDPILGWVGGPRGTGDIKTWDSTWVRLVDLEAAWPLRAYEADCDVVVEVEDRHAPWNAGRWRLSASSGAGSAARTDAAADVTLAVDVLGAGFLGHGIGGLQRAGLVREHRPGSYAELARAMRTLVEPEPSIGF